MCRRAPAAEKPNTRHRSQSFSEKRNVDIETHCTPRMNAMEGPTICMPHRVSARTRRPATQTRIAGLRRRALALVAAVLLVATMAYGESWLLGEPATACVECAVAVTVARALDGNSVDR
jgi:hypothetical protein